MTDDQQEPQPPADITGWEMVTIRDGGGPGPGLGFIVIGLCIFLIVLIIRGM